MSEIIYNIDHIAHYIKGWRIEKGFTTPSTLNTLKERDQMLGKLALVHSEISEAVEAVRKNDLDNFKEEIADTIIRLLDITGTMEFSVAQEIADKMAVNENRSLKHNTKTSL